MTFRANFSAVIIVLALLANFMGTATLPAQIQTRLSDSDTASAPATKEIDTLVICPQVFQPAMRRWIRYRIAQGHQIKVIPPFPTAYENRIYIKRFAAASKLKNIVLIGDCGDAYTSSRVKVPTDFVPAKVNVKFGSDPEIATDSTYADTNGDGLPELAIGRLPVDNVAELEMLIDRIIQYEQTSSDSEWQRRVNLVAGVGGFGQMIDKLIEQTTKQMVTDLIPSSYKTSMTYGSWRSPYCPDPRRFSQTAIERFNEGCLFWVYIGHGNRHRLDKIFLPDQAHRILDLQTCQYIGSREGSPIAIFLACYTGAMDDDRDSISEEMFKRPHGPVAVVAGSRVTMPYAMGLMSLELLQEYFGGETATLGELLRLAKVRMASESPNKSPYRTMIKTMGKMFSPKPELLKDERREHVHLMHLIGDPLLRLKRPGSLQVQAPAKADAGTTIAVQGTIDEPAELNVEIAYRRDRYRFRPPRRKEYQSSDTDFRSYQVAYEKARHLVCFLGKCKVQQGDFNIEVPIPDDANGECILSVFATDNAKLKIGSKPIFIKSKPKTRTAAKNGEDNVK